MEKDIQSAEAEVKNPDTEECFVIMPISDHTDYESGHFSRVYHDLIVPACKLAGYKAIRADEVASANLIHLDILDKIVTAPLAICDLSSQNPNVMFELGMRQAFDKPVVLIKDELTSGVFDISGIRYHSYPSSLRYDEVLKFQIKLSDAIRSTMKDCTEGSGANSIVKLLEINKATLSVEANASEGDKFVLLQSQLKRLEAMVREISRSPTFDTSFVLQQYNLIMQEALELISSSRYSVGSKLRRLAEIERKMKNIPVVDSETHSMQEHFLKEIAALTANVESMGPERR